MVMELKYMDPNDGRPVVREWSYDDEPFKVGRSGTSTVVLSPTDVSRVALLIAEHEDTRLKIACRQRGGYVQVTREDGVRKATLADGDELICGAGTYSVLLRTASQDILEITVVVADRPRMVNPGMVTVGMWNRKQIFEPTPENDWRWLAALTTVAAQTKARHQGNALRALAAAWHDGNWKANLQTRLDKVIGQLHLTGSGVDKQAAIASFVRSSGVIQPADYVAFREEVQRRAIQHLDRPDIGLLGWGDLTTRGV
jgi:hypothetical protein